MSNAIQMEAGAAVRSKIVRRLIPFLCLLFIVNYLDRTNVAMASLQMLGDTGLTDASYGLGAGLFLWGIFCLRCRAI